jgi:hypothetical protein
MNITVGKKIIQTSHKEYGVWTIISRYDSGLWEVKGRAGTVCVSECELEKFWGDA